MNSGLAEYIKGSVSEAIVDELENDGDALKLAKRLKEEVRAGWFAALADAGVPEEYIKFLAL